jgi:hypothetical protein
MNLSNDDTCNREIEKILSHPQYEIDQLAKQRSLLPILKFQITQATRNQYIASFFKKINLHAEQISSCADIPFIPVQMFKKYDLSTCDPEKIVRVVKSSATTSQIPSRIHLNKTTSFRQTAALSQTLRSYIGNKRLPFIVIDTETINKSGLAELTARGAAVRGFGAFAKNTYYILKENNAGELLVDLDLLKHVATEFQGQDVFAFGFTFLLWTVFIPQITSAGINFDFKTFKLFHGGGWKKLAAQAVSKEVFNTKAGSIFGVPTGNIIDFYGMAEQTGIIFPDCECQNKHIPDFAEVIFRNPLTLKESGQNEIGLIEVLSILSDSYYSQAFLTEDMGFIQGVDDCACGRKGKYFRFVSRVEKTENRGCGDTFALKRHE